MTPRFPLFRPDVPRFSRWADGYARVEARRVYSNNGPELRAFEQAAAERLFGGSGACLGVANATLGLMLAIRQTRLSRPRARYAIVPAFTFAATAHAVDWAGLTPLIVDVDPDSWCAASGEEERLLEEYGSQIGAVVPYAPLGGVLDLERYEWLQRRHGVGVVVDAASSLGTLGPDGRTFGAGAPFAIVYSMHATKPFAVGEGGLIQSGDAQLISTFRSMANFGFDGGRSAQLPGLNAKLTEIAALAASTKLDDIDRVRDRRSAVEAAYRAALTDFELIAPGDAPRALPFMTVLLPDDVTTRREAIIAMLADDGIGAATYLSPHLGEQPWFHERGDVGPTPVADRLSARVLSLPILDSMTAADARLIGAMLVGACEAALVT